MTERLSATSDEFHEVVRSWLRANPELLVLGRRNRAAGAKDWYLVRELTDLETVVRRSQPTDCITVFSEPQLTHRRPANDEDTTRRLAALVATSPESLVATVVPGAPELQNVEAFEPGDEDNALAWLVEHPADTVAFGPYPPFLATDASIAIDALVPHEDGSITNNGVY